jgi:predicted TPR repeat methyltransferase
MHEASPNQVTISSYETHVSEYIRGTGDKISVEHREWIDSLLKPLHSESRILELGSAYGRDALYIHNRGYRIECTDGTPGFVSYLNDNGIKAKLLNLLSDPIEGPYDLIYANAVLLHFTKDEMKFILHKICAALSQTGCFAFSMKDGIGEEWSEAKLGAPRYFCYWENQELIERLEESGFYNIHITQMPIQDENRNKLFITAIRSGNKPSIKIQSGDI